MRRLLAALLVVALSTFETAPVDAHATSSVARWRTTAIDAGWPASSWPWLACVIRRESGGNPNAVGDHGTSIGLMQIHVPAHRQWLASIGVRPSQLRSPWVNLRVARLLYRRHGTSPWRSTRHGC